MNLQEKLKQEHRLYERLSKAAGGEVVGSALLPDSRLETASCFYCGKSFEHIEIFSLQDPDWFAHHTCYDEANHDTVWMA